MSLSSSDTTRSEEPSEDDAPTDDEDVVLEVRNANVRFDMSRGQAWVLNDVDMDIYRDEILAVVGESGSGKSMFASGLLDAVEDPGLLTGDITYYPRDAESDDREIGDTIEDSTEESVDVLELTDSELDRLRWGSISMVFQGAMNSFNPTMKVEGHFRETISAHDARHDERMAYVRDLFDALHLDYDRVMESYPHELSGGMKQRALIALALVLEPEVLVMDEPTAALDLLMQRSIIAMLKHLQEAFDLTIVFITHDLSLVAGLADRIAVMYAFEFVELAKTEHLLEDAGHPYTRALLRAIPNIESDVESIQTIPGASPDPVNIPSGCSYHPRCPLADERCANEDPALAEFEEDHAAACFYTDQAREEIDYDIHGGGN